MRKLSGYCVRLCVMTALSSYAPPGIISSSALAQSVGDYKCRASWAFDAGDKVYDGFGKDKDSALQDARKKCVADNNSIGFPNPIPPSKTCATSPRTLTCGIVTAPPVPTTPAPHPAFCAMPSSSADAARIKSLPTHSNPADKTAGADKFSRAIPRIDLAPGQQISHVYCLLKEEHNDGFCSDINGPAACAYAWPMPGDSAFPRLAWFQDHWVVQVIFYNQADQRRTFQLFAE